MKKWILMLICVLGVQSMAWRIMTSDSNRTVAYESADLYYNVFQGA